MQASQNDDITNVLIDLIGTEDDGEERSEHASFSALQPSFNSAHVVAQSTARPTAAIGVSESSSASSSIRDRSGRFDFDRIREEFSRASTPKSHSDVSALSWTRSNSSQAEGERPPSGRMRSVGTSSSSRSDLISSQTPTSLVPSSQGNLDSLVANPNPRDDQTLTLLSPLKLDPPLLGDSTSSPPPRTPNVPEPTQTPAESSTIPTWQNMTELFDLMQSQMAALARALELARADSTVLRKRCLELESRLGIQTETPVLPTAERIVSPAPIHHQHLDDVRSMTPPNDTHIDRPRPANIDSAVTFIRNIDELVWRRTLFAKLPVELAVLASLPDCVRNNHDILDSVNLAALEERIRLWERHCTSEIEVPTTSPSSTNNLREKTNNEHQHTTRGTGVEGVPNLTNVVDLGFKAAGGAFSDVWKGQLKDPPYLEVAIKCPRTVGYVSDKDKERIRRHVADEIFTSSKLRHPNIIQLLGSTKVENYEYDALVMEWCSGGTLYERLQTSKLTRMEQSAMTLQLAAGMGYMHSNDIVHADLKPNNILVGPQGQIKISDFGLSRIIKNTDPTSNLAHYGAESYMAPELYDNKDDKAAVKTFNSDVWAFGIVVYQLLVHDVMLEPYSYVCREGANHYTLLKRMEAKVAGRLPYEDSIQSNELIEHFIGIIVPCWAREPTTRPRMSNISVSLYERFLKQDLSGSRWDWLFAPTAETCPKASIIEGANSDDLLRHAALKHEQGAYTESRTLRAKAAIDKLFRGRLLECADIQRELAASCVGQCDREATLHHYDSAIQKYKALGSAHAEATDICRKLRKDALEGRQFGLWSDFSDPSVKIRQAADLGEQALDRNDFATATKHYEELLDIARRDERRDIMAQACVRLAWACELESRLKLVRAKEYYLEALEYYDEVKSATLDQKNIEADLKRLEGIPMFSPSQELQ